MRYVRGRRGGPRLPRSCCRLVARAARCWRAAALRLLPRSSLSLLPCKYCYCAYLKINIHLLRLIIARTNVFVGEGGYSCLWKGIGRLHSIRIRQFSSRESHRAVIRSASHDRTERHCPLSGPVGDGKGWVYSARPALVLASTHQAACSCGALQ